MKKFYCVKQNEQADCGPACLTSICKFYDVKVSLTRIRDLAGTDKVGTNLYGLIEAAEQLGFDAKAIRTNKDNFFSDFPLPAIAHVISEQKYNHYVVLYKITKNEVIIADPAKGVVKMPPEQFFDIWAGVLLLVIPSVTGLKKDCYQDDNYIIKKIVGFVFQYNKLFTLLFVFSVFIIFLGILSTYYYQVLIDNILPQKNIYILNYVSVIILVIKIIETFFSYIREKGVILLSQRLDKELIFEAYKHVIKMPMKFFSSRRTGEILSRLQDASSIRMAISNILTTLSVDCLIICGCCIVLAFKDWKLFLISFGVAWFYFILCLLYQKKVNRISEKQMESSSHYTAQVIEAINGIQTIKALASETKAINKLEKEFDEFVLCNVNLEKTLNNQRLFKGIIDGISAIVILWFGSLRVVSGDLTIGSVMSCNAMFMFFIESVKRIVELQPMIRKAFVAVDRLNEICELDEEKYGDASNEKKMFGKILMKDISFRYGSRKLILKDFNLEIAAGEKMAIVGGSGEGKSTIAKILLRLYQYEKGEVYIDDTLLEDIDIKTLRKKIAYVPQEVTLFSGSLLENITMGIEQYDEESLLEVAQLTQIYDFIMELPQRFETHISENGLNLSGGQRQRIAIARALLMKPDIVIFDEITSGLDSVNEQKILEGLDQYFSNTTMVFVTHNMEVAKKCDKVAVIKDGKVIECPYLQESKG